MLVTAVGRAFINIIAFSLYALGGTKPNAELRPAQIPLYNTTWSQNFSSMLYTLGRLRYVLGSCMGHVRLIP